MYMVNYTLYIQINNIYMKITINWIWNQDGIYSFSKMLQNLMKLNVFAKYTLQFNISSKKLFYTMSNHL